MTKKQIQKELKKLGIDYKSKELKKVILARLTRARNKIEKEKAAVVVKKVLSPKKIVAEVKEEPKEKKMYGGNWKKEIIKVEDAEVNGIPVKRVYLDNGSTEYCSKAELKARTTIVKE